MSGLIPRLRELHGPDREVDAEIFRAVKADDPFILGVYDGPGSPFATTAAGGTIDILPYTRSLDAAVSLRIPGFTWAAGDCNEDNAPWACVTSNETSVDYGIDAATPEIAMCIAWLKARGIE